MALASIPQPDITHIHATGRFERLFMRWGDERFRDRVGHWDAAKHELTIGLVKVDAELDMNFQIASFIAFGEIELLKDYPATSVLAGYAVAVSGIVDELERSVS